ncbi:MAG: helix-turn-helix transcriptional regulator [Clostridia bacterium]|nr:helix-turn-helix transcriptional regulator [Clostridia bacterium]
MEILKKLKIAMIEMEMSQTELAKKTEQTQANLSRKMNGETITFRELDKLVKGLGCELEVNIILPDGRRI